jgi:selenocysteine-specific elongation factor
VVSPAPLTLGTAGHVDHGKTALVAALTGRDTDRLAEERRRGISIELGYAPLELPSGRQLSLVDVPGHERFVRTMVAGATGVDLFLLCVAADDGVMPQTREHVAVLAGLGVSHGVIAVTKADLADPARAAAEASALFPGAPVVTCSARTGAGLGELGEALDRAADELPAQDRTGGGAVLHVDRCFTVRGAGTVVTGTLWSGSVARGDAVTIEPAGTRARVRSVQVHDEPCERAQAGQRVALNLAGVEVREVGRGDVVVGDGASLAATQVLDVALDIRVEHGARVHVHHGTREVPARVAWLGGTFHQLRCEQPLVAARGDRLVVRSIAPPDTLGGGVVLDPGARRHGPTNDTLVRLTRLARGEDPGPGAPAAGAPPPAEDPSPAPAPSPGPGPVPAPPPLPAEALLLEQRVRASGHDAVASAELSDEEYEHLAALREAGRVARIGKDLYLHAEALARVRDRVVTIIEAEGSITIARLRDDLGTARRPAQALLERLDADRVTLRRGDERVLRRRRT